MASNPRAVACCLLNISEARNVFVVERVARAAVARPLRPPLVDTAILNVFRDKDYDRSIITLASSSTEALKWAVIEACGEAFASIDLRQHRGGHPRLGAVDLIPIHPLTPELSVGTCGVVAAEIAEALTKRVEGTSFFIFGPVVTNDEDARRCESLVQSRKRVGWFGRGGVSTPPSFPAGFVPDVGPPPNGRFGLTGVGAMPFMMNFNVTISTKDARLGKYAADAVREATGGFPGVRAMAFPHEGNVEVACNVEAVQFSGDSSASNGMVPLEGGGLFHASPEAIREKIVLYLKRYNDTNGTKVGVLDGSAIIGFSPREMAEVAAEALASGDPLYYLKRSRRMM